MLLVSQKVSTQKAERLSLLKEVVDLKLARGTGADSRLSRQLATAAEELVASQGLSRWSVFWSQKKKHPALGIPQEWLRKSI